MEDFNAIILKLVLVLVTSPAWYPFLKTVWQEFNKAMADEGGVFGRIPTPQEAEEIARQRRTEENPLIHLPHPTRAERISGRRNFREQPKDARAGSTAGASPRRAGGARSRPR